jgi:hypothetical protein
MPQSFGRYVHTIMERGADEAQAAGSATIEAEHLLLAIHRIAAGHARRHSVFARRTARSAGPVSCHGQAASGTCAPAGASPYCLITLFSSIW